MSSREQVSPVAPPVPSLARSAIGGVTWNYAGSAVLVVAQVASTAVTARLVSPSQFGAYATAQVAAGVMGYFTLTALGNGLLRRSELDGKAIGTAVWLSLIASALVAGAMALLAAPWAGLWGINSAATLVRVLAATLFLTSVATVPLAMLRRNLRFASAVVVETGAQVVAVSAGVGMAFALHSALALAIGQVVGAGVLLMVSVALVRPALNVSFARAEARELLSFSGQVSALNLSFFTLNTVPSWVTARFFGARVFGFYSRANVTVNLPLTYLATSFTKVLYPFYGRVRADTARTRVLLNEALLLTTGFTWPLFALIAGAAPVVVRALLGPGWDDASRLLSLCALAACANLPCVVLTNAAEAFGWMRVIWVRQLAYVAVLGAAIAIVVIGDLRLEWLLVGVAAAQWVTYLLTAGEFFQRGHLARETVLTSQAIHGAFALAAYAGAAACARILEDSSLGLQVVAEMSFGVVVVFILVRGRSWLPASSVLSRRLTQILPNKDRNILMRLAGMTSR